MADAPSTDPTPLESSVTTGPVEAAPEAAVPASADHATTTSLPQPTPSTTVQPEAVDEKAVEKPEPITTDAPPAAEPEPAPIVAVTTAEPPKQAEPAMTAVTPPAAPAAAPTAEATPAAATAVATPAVDASTSSPPVPAAVPTTETLEPASAASPAPVEDGKKVDEPQNALTKKFTTAEWASINQLRKELPAIFEEAYKEKKDAKPTSITLWGVPINSLNPKADARVTVILLKFLRARNLSVREAKTMLINTLRWRDEFNVEAAMKEEFPKDVFDGIGYTFKTDKDGRPVCYNLYGAIKDTKVVFGDVQRFLRWRVKLMEETVLQCDFETVDQTVQVHDYEGVSMSSRDANSKSAASEASNIFSSHYPELLYRKYFINVPTLMSWIFWAFKAIVPSATFSKMSVVGSSKHEIKKVLGEIVEVNNLPKRYGGEAEAF
ncbi:CRAL/TRIO domain-containing protein [Cylindrobasidium torrendii FP15055 ss-10]|uniref:Phosphatidylinositol transfer protein SFH5 n=1 Tax=Cylindrobasidium torrendii FP15055 ss-10 TaxID=1314674 RepID=A0A0D7BF76_9AGAR|nr:CRAL/TRIO domain-containing protein [Cylindrobasidium torrendii FP15055 ss-10]